VVLEEGATQQLHLTEEQVETHFSQVLETEQLDQHQQLTTELMEELQ
jgi:hypothetical protein